jgi:hypothetical protein
MDPVAYRTIAAKGHIVNLAPYLTVFHVPGNCATKFILYRKLSQAKQVSE